MKQHNFLIVFIYFAMLLNCSLSMETMSCDLMVSTTGTNTGNDDASVSPFPTLKQALQCAKSLDCLNKTSNMIQVCIFPGVYPSEDINDEYNSMVTIIPHNNSHSLPLLKNFYFHFAQRTNHWHFMDIVMDSPTFEEMDMVMFTRVNAMNMKMNSCDMLRADGSLFSASLKLNGVEGIIVENCTFENNNGVDLHEAEGVSSFSNCTFRNNEGFFNLSGTNHSAPDVTFKNCIFENNKGNINVGNHVHSLALVNNVFECNNWMKPILMLSLETLVYTRDNQVSAVCPTECPGPGLFSKDGLFPCQPCSPGYYSTTVSATSCTPCPIGSEAPYPQSSNCTTCDSYSYTPGEGYGSCLLCTNGTFSNTQRNDCFYPPSGTSIWIYVIAALIVFLCIVGIVLGIMFWKKKNSNEYGKVSVSLE